MTASWDQTPVPQRLGLIEQAINRIFPGTFPGLIPDVPDRTARSELEVIDQAISRPAPGTFPELVPVHGREAEAG